MILILLTYFIILNIIDIYLKNLMIIIKKSNHNDVINYFINDFGILKGLIILKFIEIFIVSITSYLISLYIPLVSIIALIILNVVLYFTIVANIFKRN